MNKLLDALPEGEMTYWTLIVIGSVFIAMAIFLAGVLVGRHG